MSNLPATAPVGGEAFPSFKKGPKKVKDGITIDDAKLHLVQVGQPFAGAIVAMVAHQRVVVPRRGLSFVLEGAGLLAAQMGMQHFDGCLLIEPGMLPKVDVRKAPRA